MRWRKQPHEDNCTLVAIQDTPDTQSAQGLWGLYAELQPYEEPWLRIRLAQVSQCHLCHVSSTVPVWRAGPPNCPGPTHLAGRRPLKASPCPCSQCPIIPTADGREALKTSAESSRSGRQKPTLRGGQPCVPSSRLFHLADLPEPLEQSHRLWVLTEDRHHPTRGRATGASGAWALSGCLQGEGWQLKAIHWHRRDMGTAPHSTVHNPTTEHGTHGGGNPLPDPPRATKADTAICFMIEFFNKQDTGTWPLIFFYNSFMEYHSRNIKLILFKCTIQWFWEHSQSGATLATNFKTFSGAEILIGLALNV